VGKAQNRENRLKLEDLANAQDSVMETARSNLICHGPVSSSQRKIYLAKDIRLGKELGLEWRSAEASV
jgi:hypothetical protein